MKKVILSMTLLSMSAAMASAQIIPDGIYNIFPKGTEVFRIDNAANRGEDGNNIHIWENNDTDAQRWRVENRGDGVIVIHSMNNENKVVDNEGFNPCNNNNISIYQDNNTPNQIWITEKTADGCVVLRTAQDPRFVLSCGPEQVHNGQNIMLYEYNGTDWQKWNFTPVYNNDNGSQGIETVKMEGYLGSMNVEMQLTLIPDTGNDEKGKVKGWFQDKLNPGKVEFSGTYTGSLIDCEIKASYVEDGQKYTLDGQFIAGYMPGIGEVGTFSGMWRSAYGTEMDFEVSNM